MKEADLQRDIARGRDALARAWNLASEDLNGQVRTGQPAATAADGGQNGTGLSCGIAAGSQPDHGRRRPEWDRSWPRDRSQIAAGSW